MKFLLSTPSFALNSIPLDRIAFQLKSLINSIFITAGVTSTVPKKTTTVSSTATKSTVGASRLGTTASRPATARTASATTTGRTDQFLPCLNICLIYGRFFSF